MKTNSVNQGNQEQTISNNQTAKDENYIAENELCCNDKQILDPEDTPNLILEEIMELSPKLESIGVGMTIQSLVHQWYSVPNIKFRNQDNKSRYSSIWPHTWQY